MNIEQILLDLGYKLNDRGGYWQAAALYRGGDNTTALQIYKNSGAWVDYVEDPSFRPFISLVQKTLNTNDPDVLRKYNHGKFKIAPKPKALLQQEKTYSPDCLSRLLPHYDFYLKKNISEDVLSKYRCGLATSGKLYQRLVFPIFNAQGRIHGFSGRSITDREPKWLHNGKKSNWFFPYYNIDTTIRDLQSVYLIESIGDSLALTESGVTNHLVSFGLSLSPQFISKLMGLNLNYIGLAFNNDNDKEVNRGLLGSLKMLVKLSKFFDIQKLWVVPPTENDFGDMNDPQIQAWRESLLTKSHEENMTDAIKQLDEFKVFTKFSKSFLKDFDGFKKKVDFYYGK